MTIDRQLAAFGQVDQIIARHRATVPFGSLDPLASAFAEIERLEADGRLELLVQKASAAPQGRTPMSSGPAATMSAARRKEILGTTELGRQILREEAAKDPERVTATRLTPERRKELLESSSWGRAILADESKARR